MPPDLQQLPILIFNFFFVFSFVLYLCIGVSSLTIRAVVRLCAWEYFKSQEDQLTLCFKAETSVADPISCTFIHFVSLYRCVELDDKSNVVRVRLLLSKNIKSYYEEKQKFPPWCGKYVKLLSIPRWKLMRITVPVRDDTCSFPLCLQFYYVFETEIMLTRWFPWLLVFLSLIQKRQIRNHRIQRKQMLWKPSPFIAVSFFFFFFLNREQNINDFVQFHCVVNVMCLLSKMYFSASSFAFLSSFSLRDRYGLCFVTAVAFLWYLHSYFLDIFQAGSWRRNYTKHKIKWLEMNYLFEKIWSFCWKNFSV